MAPPSSLWAVFYPYLSIPPPGDEFGGRGLDLVDRHRTTKGPIFIYLDFSLEWPPLAVLGPFSYTYHSPKKMFLNLQGGSLSLIVGSNPASLKANITVRSFIVYQSARGHMPTILLVIKTLKQTHFR